MGNCLVTKSVDTVSSTPRARNAKGNETEEAPKQLVVDMSKRRNHETEEDNNNNNDVPVTQSVKLHIISFSYVN